MNKKNANSPAAPVLAKILLEGTPSPLAETALTWNEYSVWGFNESILYWAKIRPFGLSGGSHWTTTLVAVKGRLSTFFGAVSGTESRKKRRKFDRRENRKLKKLQNDFHSNEESMKSVKMPNVREWVNRILNKL
uniref:Uncharacterized protein n=1 Tax=Romanomermis culicivorax TaxID=13658 RepID=A0A915KHK7_ROMCU